MIHLEKWLSNNHSIGYHEPPKSFVEVHRNDLFYLLSKGRYLSKTK